MWLPGEAFLAQVAVLISVGTEIEIVPVAAQLEHWQTVGFVYREEAVSPHWCGGKKKAPSSKTALTNL